jgi:hypothetical protein
MTAVPDYEFTSPQEASASGRFIAERNTQFKVRDDNKFYTVPLTGISSAAGAELRDGNVVISQAGFWQVSAYARVGARAGSRYGLACRQIGSGNVGTSGTATSNGIIMLTGLVAVEAGWDLPVSASFLSNGGDGIVQQVRLSGHWVAALPAGYQAPADPYPQMSAEPDGTGLAGEPAAGGLPDAAGGGWLLLQDGRVQAVRLSGEQVSALSSGDAQ